jgi:hypothetical protein
MKPGHLKKLKVNNTKNRPRKEYSAKNSLMLWLILILTNTTGLCLISVSHSRTYHSPYSPPPLQTHVWISLGISGG